MSDKQKNNTIKQYTLLPRKFRVKVGSDGKARGSFSPVTLPDDIENHWRRVKKGMPQECWPWQGPIRSSKGISYGVTVFQGQVRSSHLVSYELINGAIVEGLVIRHICNNPLCQNPAHLVAGTQRENVQDAINSGAFPRGDRSGYRKHPEAFPFGDKSPKTKIPSIHRALIPALYGLGVATMAEIAGWYEVTPTQISRIVNNKSRKRETSYQPVGTASVSEMHREALGRSRRVFDRETLLLMREWDERGMSYTDIARRVGKSLSAVYAWLVGDYRDEGTRIIANEPRSGLISFAGAGIELSDDAFAAFAELVAKGFIDAASAEMLLEPKSGGAVDAPQ